MEKPQEIKFLRLAIECFILLALCIAGITALIYFIGEYLSPGAEDCIGIVFGLLLAALMAWRMRYLHCDSEKEVNGK